MLLSVYWVFSILVSYKFKNWNDVFYSIFCLVIIWLPIASWKAILLFIAVAITHRYISSNKKS